MNNILKASDFTRKLSGPKWNDIFPNHALEPAQTERGRAVYAQHCSGCHGQPDAQSGEWKVGERYGELVTLKEIGTDPERLTFRHFARIPDALTEHFPKHHPFKFERKVLRPGPAGTTVGYINSEISSTFSRAPYLHNASVPTLAQLIHLERRPVRFYRGMNHYDPIQAGLAVKDEPTDAAYFLFDTTQRGNSNSGHNYPWAYDSPDRNEEQLRDLLEYLKSL